MQDPPLFFGEVLGSICFLSLDTVHISFFPNGFSNAASLLHGYSLISCLHVFIFSTCALRAYFGPRTAQVMDKIKHAFCPYRV